MDEIRTLLEGVRLPRMFRVRQIFDHTCIRREELRRTVSHLLTAEKLGKRICPGMRVALPAGSREICNMDEILAAAVECLKEQGARPFIVPAMGSHGGATAEGQRELLASYQITEERCGCPILSSMETVPIGSTPDGQTVFLDRYAAEADGILVVNRMKAHTGFRGRYESGILKMMVIGLGKQTGAEACHRRGFGHMAEDLEAFGRVVLQKAPILGAIAILENAFDETAQLVWLEPEEILEREPGLLEQAKAQMPQILLPECDVLIVDEIGKNYSGTGMDPNVTGRHVTPYCSGGLRVQRIAVLRMSGKSHCNGYGIGAADCTTQAVYRTLDLRAMYINGLTCGEMGPCRIPCVWETEKLAIQAAVRMCEGIGRQGPRMIRIPNTLSLEKIMVSENLRAEVEKNPRLEIRGEPENFIFGEDGCLSSSIG